MRDPKLSLNRAHVTYLFFKCLPLNPKQQFPWVININDEGRMPLLALFSVCFGSVLVVVLVGTGHQIPKSCRPCDWRLQS